MPGAERAEDGEAERVELERGSDPIRGTIGAPGGPMVAFTGWMELAAALEAAHVACEAESRP